MGGYDWQWGSEFLKSWCCTWSQMWSYVLQKPWGVPDGINANGGGRVSWEMCLLCLCFFSLPSNGDCQTTAAFPLCLLPCHWNIKSCIVHLSLKNWSPFLRDVDTLFFNSKLLQFCCLLLLLLLFSWSLLLKLGGCRKVPRLCGFVFSPAVKAVRSQL